MTRHSFIQMSKLYNVKGRISYITSHARQENLYATYRTADSTFWSNLARESQQEFQRSGTEGKCIEARELIIALPEIYTQYEPQQGTHGLYRGVPQAVRCGVRVRPPPQQAQDKLSYPSDFQREEVAPRT